jgi:hypothetical protein
MTTTCPNGHTNPDRYRHCGKCGVSLPAPPQTCPNGHTNPDAYKYCGQCGAPVDMPHRSAPQPQAGQWPLADPPPSSPVSLGSGREDGTNPRFSDGRTPAQDQKTETTQVDGYWRPPARAGQLTTKTLLIIGSGFVAIVAVVGVIALIAAAHSGPRRTAAESQYLRGLHDSAADEGWILPPDSEMLADGEEICRKYREGRDWVDLWGQGEGDVYDNEIVGAPLNLCPDQEPKLP